MAFGKHKDRERACSLDKSSFSGWVCAALTVVVACFAGKAQDSPETQLKATFLANCAKFSEWPAAAFPEKQTPLVIGILGSDPFGAVLDEAIRDEKIHDRPVILERYQKLEEVKTCHILYIGQSEAERLEAIISAFKKRPVLTVSEIEGAAFKGAIIRFVTEGNRVRLRINQRAAKAAELRLSSKLLRLAEVVETID